MQIQNNVGWNFDNTYIKLPEIFFELQKPNPVKKPKLVMLNSSYAQVLGLSPEILKSDKSLQVFAGNELPEGADPLAQAYAGHQYGHFTMLGDGRAILLGEHMTQDGTRIDIQLKGAGRTPYSRGGDGRATLGPMLREYIISEAMFALGIPTTRSLAVVTTGETILREKELPGAILTRVAASHIRVGTFQYAASLGNKDTLQALADYTIQRHFPKIEDDENRYLSFLREVAKRQAKLIAQWQSVGFIHGVMNTDNMTISGETIDYGPCAFMDAYHPETVFSSIDRRGRYAYQNQPGIAVWNLARFAETLLSLLDEDVEKAVDMAEVVLSEFEVLFDKYWLELMGKKLGILKLVDGDRELINELLDLMYETGADYTNSFRALTLGKLEGMSLFEGEGFKRWYEKWQERIALQGVSEEEVHLWMKKSNPAVIPRNYRVEEALEAANTGDFSVMEKLLEVLVDPFAYSEEQDEYAELPPDSCGPYQTFCGT